MVVIRGDGGRGMRNGAMVTMMMCFYSFIIFILSSSLHRLTTSFSLCDLVYSKSSHGPGQRRAWRASVSENAATRAIGWKNALSCDTEFPMADLYWEREGGWRDLAWLFGVDSSSWNKCMR